MPNHPCREGTWPFLALRLRRYYTRRMQHREVIRPSDSPLVENIRLIQFTAAGEMAMTPDACWDIAVFWRADGGVHVLRTGLTTHAVDVTHEAGDEILVISFKPSIFMPVMPGDEMRDRGVFLETFGRDRFRIGSDVLEIPTLENADAVITKLVRNTVVESNDFVASVIAGRPKAATERTLQRHFLRTTGLTLKKFTLIQRAERAVALLQTGRPSAEIALDLGYADQAHMINSLRAIMGRTPGQIARNASPA